LEDKGRENAAKVDSAQSSCRPALRRLRIGTTPFTFVLRRDRVTKKRSNSLTSGILELLCRESDPRKIPPIRQHRPPLDTRRSGQFGHSG
jgi:hypothetical protein